MAGCSEAQSVCSQSTANGSSDDVVKVQKEEIQEEDFPRVKDKYCLVLLVFLLNGGAIWLGWNLINFLGPTYYFDYWFSSQVIHHVPTSYATKFLQSLGELACSPLFVMAILAIIPIVWLPVYIPFLASIVGSIATLIVLLIGACTWMPSFADIPSFYNFSLITICVYMGFVGVFQTYLFGMAADLPSYYTTAIVIGTNIGGIIASLCYIISTGVNPSTPNPVAVGYYSFTIAYLVLCAASVVVFWKSGFFQAYQVYFARKRQTSCCDPKRFFKNMGEVFCKAWKELLNILMVFFTMYGVFPVLCIGIQPWPAPGMAHLKPYYLPVGTFLNFYVFATIGAVASLFITIKPTNNRLRTLLMVPSYLGIYSILYFMFCNFIPNPPKKRTANVVFKNVWFFFIGNALFGLFMGFMSAILMTLTPKVVRPELSRMAGMMAAATLVTGLYLGAGMSNGFVNIVSN